MANFQHKEGFGSLFRNKNKTAENQPAYRGEIMVGGKVWEIAGWMKNGANGPYMSLKAQEPRQRNTESSRGVRDMGEDIPW